MCLQERWGEAARRLANVLNDDTFRSIEGKSKHQLWLELCDLITKHPADVLKEGIDVDAILRGGIRKYKDEVRGAGPVLGHVVRPAPQLINCCSVYGIVKGRAFTTSQVSARQRLYVGW